MQIPKKLYNRSMKVKILKLLSLVVIIITLCTIFFGLSHFGLVNHTKEQMVDCIFMQEHTRLCEVSPIGHIQAWQDTFVTLPKGDKVSLLSTLLVILLLLGLKSLKKSYLADLLRLETYINFFCLSSILVSDPLKEALARGILNSKAF